VQLLRLEGPDTLRFLHGQTSQDLQTQRPGAWLSTCCLTPTGRLLALAEVLVEEGGAWLVITAGDAAAVRAAFDRVLFPADDVRLGELRAAVETAAVVDADPFAAAAGPAARWSPWEEGEGWWLGERLVRSEGTSLPPDLAGRQPVTDWGLELLRISAGRPAAPTEIGDATNPFELGLAPRVSLAKGCYAGQETLARLATYDGVKQQLRRWRWVEAAGGDPDDPPAPPAAGTALRTAAGERAGTVTSALTLPRSETGDARVRVGLALVRRAALDSSVLLPADQPGVELDLSLPEAFVDPPVGAGGGAAS
jgi:folate-binding protein YgfZ